MSADGEQGGVLLPCPFCGGGAYIRHVEAHDHTPVLKALCPNIEPAADTYWPECACGAVKEGCNTRADAIAAWNTRAAPATDTPEVVRAKERISDAMRDSQYLAGVKAGWNAAHADDPQAAYAAIDRAHAGYLSGFVEARAALAKHPTSPEDAA